MEAVRFEVVGRLALDVEKEPRRLLSPEYKFIGRPEEAQLLEVSGQAFRQRPGQRAPRICGVANYSKS